MPDAKLTDLAEYAGGILQPDDWLYMVDTSDIVTDGDPAGSGFKIKFKDAVGRALFYQDTDPPLGEFDITTIPTGWNRIVLMAQVRSLKAAVTVDTWYMWWNTDLVAGNYHSQIHYTANATTPVFSEFNAPVVGFSNAASSEANQWGMLKITIDGYDTGKVKSARCEFDSREAAFNCRVGIGRMGHNSLVAPITRIRLRPATHPTDFGIGTVRGYVEM
jgi:hypothetical protein